MKKTYQKPAALVVRVVTGNLMDFSLPKTAVGAQNRGLTKRMYEIEVE